MKPAIRTEVLSVDMPDRQDVRFEAIEANPLRECDDKPGILIPPAFGAHKKSLIETTGEIAAYSGRRIISYVQPHYALEDPREEVIPMYRATSHKVLDKIHARADQIDAIGSSLGALSVAVALHYTPDRIGDVVLMSPLGSTAAIVHGSEYAEITSIKEFEQRQKAAQQNPSAARATWELAKRFFASSVRDGWTMARENPRIWVQATKGTTIEGLRNARMGRRGLVVWDAFAVAARIDIARELRDKGGVAIVTGEQDSVFPPEEIAQTWRVGRELNHQEIVSGVRHPWFNQNAGRLLTKAAVDRLNR